MLSKRRRRRRMIKGFDTRLSLNEYFNTSSNKEKDYKYKLENRRCLRNTPRKKKYGEKIASHLHA